MIYFLTKAVTLSGKLRDCSRLNAAHPSAQPQQRRGSLRVTSCCQPCLPCQAGTAAKALRRSAFSKAKRTVPTQAKMPDLSRIPVDSPIKRPVENQSRSKPGAEGEKDHILLSPSCPVFPFRFLPRISIPQLHRRSRRSPDMPELRLYLKGTSKN